VGALGVQHDPRVQSRRRRPPARRILRSWTLAATAIAQSGAPFSLLSGGYITQPDGSVVPVAGLGTSNSLANSGQNTVATSLTAPEIRAFLGIRKSAAGTATFVNGLGAAFREPEPGDVGNLQRRIFRGPAAVDLNVGVRRTITLHDAMRVELRAEAVKLLNRVDWLVPDQALLGTDAQSGSAVFSNGLTQWNRPRTFQLGVRVAF
jgi:hypothetical protein